MQYKIEGSIRNKKFLDALMPSLIKQLGLCNTRKVLVVNIEHTDSSAYGYTIALNFLDAYVIVIKPTRKLKEMGLTLAHEMVHVRQMAKGILKDGPNKTKVWAGKQYSKKTKYLDMPWELDAFARAEILFRRAMED
jgi:hypothetical protein